jgi:hypothetical protein
VSALGAALRRAGELLVEPAPAPPAASTTPVDVVVTALVVGAGATTVARGLAHALGRRRPVALTCAASAGAVAAGPGTAVVRDTPAAEAGLLHHRGHGRVLVAVADARREPALPALVSTVLAQRHDRVVLIGNRVRDTDAWRAAGALCVPDSRLGAWLLSHGHRPLGAMAAAFDAIAVELQLPGGR